MFQHKFIPLFYPHIVDEGIDLKTALSVIDESIENTKLDFSEFNGIDEAVKSTKSNFTKFNRIDVISSSSYNSKIKSLPFEENPSGIYFPEFPFTKTLYIQPDRIGPYGGDNYIKVNKNFPQSSYWVPLQESFSPDVIKEYQMTKRKNNKDYSIIGCRKGWNSCNVDSRAVFYKNLIMALDNAVVREKYNL